MPFSSANALRPACSSVEPDVVLKLYTARHFLEEQRPTPGP